MVRVTTLLLFDVAAAATAAAAVAAAETCVAEAEPVVAVGVVVDDDAEELDDNEDAAPVAVAFLTSAGVNSPTIAGGVGSPLMSTFMISTGPTERMWTSPLA